MNKEVDRLKKAQLIQEGEFLLKVVERCQGFKAEEIALKKLEELLEQL